MKRALETCVAVLGVVSLVVPWPAPLIAQNDQARPSAALRIVVLEGEGSVNIIQQKTAVSPLVEVRDRNDLPIAGVPVTFTIGSGGATFAGGAQTLTVVTNAAGRAMAAGLTPTANGALQISASALFEGQTAAATIAQTNVLTAAQAAAAGGGGGAGGSSAGAGGAAGGSGGGLSATTIGIIGGAAAGGAIAAKEVLAGSDSTRYRGNYSGAVQDVFIPSLSFCSRTISHAGTVEADIHVNDDGTVNGVGVANGTMAMASFSGPQICAINPGTQPHSNSGPMTGTRNAMAWQASHAGAPGVTVTYEFTGAESGEAIVGTFIFTVSGPDGVGRGVFPVTLQKQP